MVDIKKSKCYRLFSLPYRPLAINMVINNENTVVGYDNCGYSYIGKLGEDFKVCLVSFNPNEETTCLMGTIDFDKKRILGEWLSDKNLENVILEMVSYSSDSLLESLPEHNVTFDDTILENQTSSKVKKYLIEHLL